MFYLRFHGSGLIFWASYKIINLHNIQKPEFRKRCIWEKAPPSQHSVNKGNTSFTITYNSINQLMPLTCQYFISQISAITWIMIEGLSLSVSAPGKLPPSRHLMKMSIFLQKYLVLPSDLSFFAKQCLIRKFYLNSWTSSWQWIFFLYHFSLVSFHTF